VLQVESFNAQYPISVDAIVFPTDWIVVQNETGSIQMVPRTGSFSQFLVARDASLLPLFVSGLTAAIALQHAGGLDILSLSGGSESSLPAATGSFAVAAGSGFPSPSRISTHSSAILHSF
jgi:hypothetical protein